MFGFTSQKAAAAARLASQHADLKERSDLLDDACGIGLWEAVLHDSDAFHAQSRWTWSPEFRRLIGYQSESEFPNVCQSWSDRLHPDDASGVFAAFKAHLADRSGKTRYQVAYRLKVRDGSYRWFRATGGCRHSETGRIVRTCGSLTDIHDQRLAEVRVEEAASGDRRTMAAISSALASMAGGDLTHRIDGDLPANAEALKADFNATAEKLLTIILQITGSTIKMQAGAQNCPRQRRTFPSARSSKRRPWKKQRPLSMRSRPR